MSASTGSTDGLREHSGSPQPSIWDFGLEAGADGLLVGVAVLTTGLAGLAVALVDLAAAVPDLLAALGVVGGAVLAGFF